MSLSNSSLLKAPFKVFKIEPTTAFNKKYALKFLHCLIVRNKTRLNETTRYLKRVYQICGDERDMYQINPEIFKMIKRSSKSCKIIGVFDPKALPLSFLPALLTPANLFNLSQSFKLGIFTALILEMKTPPEKFATKSQVSEYLSKVARTMNRFKSLQDLIIFFDEKTLDITNHFLQELQKFPQKISSLHSCQLHYQGSSIADINRLPNNFTPSITQLTVKIHQIDPFVLKPQDFPKLTFLSFTIDVRVKSSLLDFFVSFKDLPNLETFIFKCGDNTYIEILEFLQAFHLPKSVKNVSLTLKINFEEYIARVLSKLKISQAELSKLAQQKKSFLFKLVHYFKSRKQINQLMHGLHNSFEEFDCFKEFYDKWEQLDKLSNLTLNISSPPKCHVIDFLFVTPILKRCKNITSLSLQCGRKALLSFCQIGFAVNLSVGWEQIYNALEPFKDTLQCLNLEICSVNFEMKNPPRLVLKNIENLQIFIHATKSQYLQKILNIMPPEEELKARVQRKFKLSVEACVWNKRDLKELLNGIKCIPRNLHFRLGSFVDGMSVKTFKKRMVDFVSSAQIEGNLQLDLSGEEIDPINLKSFLDKVRNQFITGSLSIYGYNSRELKFQIKEERFLDEIEF